MWTPSGVSPCDTVVEISDVVKNSLTDVDVTMEIQHLDMVSQLTLCTAQTAHLIQYSWLPQSCTMEDLLVFNGTAKVCVEHWKE